ncbi:glycosyltransferase [Segetibacter sp.]|uniref:glycosyltransferase n=1 Tax=Segetibacter sp. TaxID=2231182 RepID=UPI00260A466F|nr:glycosyltransferase [Segetibacter sp.]MCW3079616.1 glycosyl transferase [Segetibacter sp.]
MTKTNSPCFSIIIGFRNREIFRIKYVLESLGEQIFKNFELIFVDYGSEPHIQKEAQDLVTSYGFAKYLYSDTRGWFWNRSHALNTGIRKASGDVIIISDIDLIFPVDFLESVQQLSFENIFYTFNCHYLSADTDYSNITKSDLEKSIINYVGLCAIAKTDLLAVNCFDEYYLNWGGEDDDLYVRLENNGCQKQQMKVDKFPVLHQWHERQSPAYPTPWYLDMITYLYSIVPEKKAEKRQYGLLVETSQRVVLDRMNELDCFKKLELFPNPLFQFNLFLNEFFKMEPGGLGRFDFPIERPLPKGRKQKLVERINNQLSKFRFPYLLQKQVSIIPVHSRQAWFDFVQYFIGKNRALVNDYYLVNTDNTLALLFQKK